MNSILSFFFLLLFSSSVYSQSDLLLPVRHGNELIFYKPDGTEKFKVKNYEFERSFLELNLDCFYDGLCFLRKGERDNYTHYYIDTTGTVVIDLGKNSGKHFSEGLAEIYDITTRRRNFIDIKGNRVIENLSPHPYFSEGLTMVQYAREDSLSFIDKTGKIQFKKTRKGVNFSPHLTGFSNSLALFQHTSKRYSYMNKQGEIVIKGDYSKAKKFSEGLASIQVKYKTCGFIDTLGNLAFSVDGEQCESFSDGLAAVKNKGRWGYVDTKGEWVIPAKYQEVYPFKDGNAVVRNTNQWSVIDHKGAIVFQDSLANYLQYLGDDVVFVNYHGKNNYAYFQLDSSLIIAPHSDYVQYASFDRADQVPLESIKSFSYHPFHKQFFEQVWKETPYFISLKKKRWSRNSTSFPMEILKYTHLEKLDLSYNRFSEIPKEVCSLKNLTTLDLRGNPFEEFPKNLECLKNLKSLDLSFSDVTRLPEEGLVFKNIQDLNILYTPIAKDPALLAALKKHFPNATIISSRKSQWIEVEEEK